MSNLREAPAEGQRFKLRYWSTQNASERILRGEVTEVIPDPERGDYRVAVRTDAHSTRHIVIDGNTAIVLTGQKQKPRTEIGRGTYE